MTFTFRSLLLAGAAFAALGSPAYAASTKSDTEANIQALQRTVADLDRQLQDLKRVQADQQSRATDADSSAALVDLKRSTTDQYVDLSGQISALDKPSVNNGRLQVTSADGRFSAAVRVLAQYDTAVYSQTHAANLLPASYGPDFSSGSNFRRIYLGVSGKLFGDWTYNANFDFGGSGGTETPGHVQSVYVEYDGLAPWAFRIGAFPPPASLEDGTSSGDTIFIERNSPSDMQRNIAGGDGRDGISLLYTGPTLFGALSYTGDKVGDGVKALAAAGATASATFGEQQAVVGRLSWLPFSGPDFNWLIGVNGTYVIRPPNLTTNTTASLSTTPGAAARNAITLSDPPELTVDSNGYTLPNTGSLAANHLTQWGVETAAAWHNLYAQAGYYGFQVDRAPVAFTTTSGTQIVTPANNNFSAWYAQATWILTGESRTYNAATGAFTPPKVAHVFNLADGGLGAWELAARYSDTDLNDHILSTSNVITAASGASRTYDFYNTVRGGDQRILTAGLNWYPNNAIRFALNYELIQNSKLQSGTAQNALTGITATGTATTVPAIPAVSASQNLSAVALRAQLSF